jgi:hypothetical protein
MLSKSRGGEEQAIDFSETGFTPGKLEVIITDSPVTDYEKRNVLDWAAVEFSAIDRWLPLKLRGEKPEHQFNVRLRHRGFFVEVEVEIVLHGTISHKLTMRNRADLKINKLWLSRGYYHGDLGRACFRAAEPPVAFRGSLWFATLGGPEARVVGETRRPYGYGEEPAGRVQLDLHDGYHYALDWKAHKDGYGRDYRARWLKGDELLSETLDTVFAMKEARAARCASLMLGGYCDTDYI